MKNLKTILALLLCFTLLGQVVLVNAATNFSDVNRENNTFSEAIYTLTDFGILKGDAGADTFRPKANISREEFSVIVDRIMGMGDLNVTVTEYIFSDVTPETCDDWSIKATKIAYDLGIISGMGDGTFAPKSPVTYEQAVKMIVCALGYNHLAIEKGGWPNGYMAVARELGLTKKCEMTQSAPASREIIAQLVYNSLEVDLVSAITNGDVVNYEIVKGQNILTQKLKYTSSNGIVLGNSSKTITNVGKIDEGYVVIKANGNTSVDKFSEGTIDTTPYIGKNVKYYYKLNNYYENELVAVLENNTNSELTVDISDIAVLTSTALTYYTDDDHDETETVSISGSPYIVFNSQYASGETINTLKPEILAGSGSLKLTDYNNDNVYDVFSANIVSIFVIDAIDSGNYKIYDKYDQAKTLTLKDSSSNKVTIKKNGSTIKFNHLATNDVLLVTESKNSNKVINIEVVTNTKEGTLNGIASDLSIFQIGSREYHLSKQLINKLTNDSSLVPAIDEKIIAYFNNENEIIEILNEGASTNYKYAYIYASGTDNRNEHIILKLFTSDGKILPSVKIAPKININGTQYTYDDAKNYTTPGDPAYQILSHLTRGQLIEYSINSNGYLNNVLTADISQTDPNKYLIPYSNTVSNEEYSENSRTLGRNVTLSSTTKVMFIPTASDISNTDEYSISDYQSLRDKATYDFYAYDLTETGVAKIVVISGYQMSVSDATVVVVENITYTQSGIKLSCYVNGTLENLYTEDPDSTCLDSFARGDVIRLKFNASSRITDATLMFTPSAVPAEQTTVSEMQSMAQNNTDTETDYRYFAQGNDYNKLTADYLTIFGTAYARDTERTTVSLFDVDETVADGVTSYSLDSTELFPVTFSSDTSFYVVDTNLNLTSSNYLTKGTLNNIAGFVSSKSGATRLFAYSKEGETQLIVILVE